jgi:hypothetical protein
MTDVAPHFNSSQFIKGKGIRLDEEKWVRMRGGTPRGSETVCSDTCRDVARQLNELPSCQSV